MYTMCTKIYETKWTGIPPNGTNVQNLRLSRYFWTDFWIDFALIGFLACGKNLSGNIIDGTWTKKYARDGMKAHVQESFY